MPASSRCDLVLLSWNHLECTRPCVESILSNTQIPCRLIIVDQNSDGETQSYLSQLRSTPTVDVEVLFNPANVGYPRGMNLGLKRATAPYVCFLNNDILVPPGWLEELIRVAESDPTLGAVNPCSNTFSIHPAPGSDYLQMSRQQAARAQGQWTEIKYAVGFCLLAQRQLLLKVGGFDETTYEQIYFEDADLGRKLHALGYRCAMAEGTYVWHEGGHTMSQQSEGLRLFQENERRFIAKWGMGRRVLYAVEKTSPQALRRAGELAREEANRIGEVWLMVADGRSSPLLPKHLSIRISRHPRWLLPWVACWKTLTKKKGFEAVCTDSRLLRAALTPLRPLHRAALEPLPLEEGGSPHSH